MPRPLFKFFKSPFEQFREDFDRELWRKHPDEMETLFRQENPHLLFPLHEDEMEEE